MFAALVSVLALIAVDDTTAQAAAPQQPQSEAERRAAEREAELDRVVCRREHVVGSNRRQRICMTVREWAHERDRAQEQMRDGGLRQGDASTVQNGM